MNVPLPSPAKMMLRRHGITALLCLLLAGMMVLTAYETDWGSRLRLPAGTTKTAPQAPAPVALLPPYAMAPLDPTFRETVERPLFVPTRRPSPPANAAPVAAMRKGQYRLTGTSVNSNMSMAFLVDKTSGKSLRAVKGAEVGFGSGIKVDSIGATRVVLRQGDETEELTLNTAASPQLAAAPTNAGTAVVGGGNVPVASGASSPSSGPSLTLGSPPAPIATVSATANPAPWIAPPLPVPLPSPNAPAADGVQTVSPVAGALPSTPQAGDSSAQSARRRRFPNVSPAQ